MKHVSSDETQDTSPGRDTSPGQDTSAGQAGPSGQAEWPQENWRGTGHGYAPSGYDYRTSPRMKLIMIDEEMPLFKAGQPVRGKSFARWLLGDRPSPQVEAQPYPATAAKWMDIVPAGDGRPRPLTEMAVTRMYLLPAGNGSMLSLTPDGMQNALAAPVPGWARLLVPMVPAHLSPAEIMAMISEGWCPMHRLPLNDMHRSVEPWCQHCRACWCLGRPALGWAGDHPGFILCRAQRTDGAPLTMAELRVTVEGIPS